MTTIIIGFVFFNILNIPLYSILFKKFFADKEDFKESLFYFFRSDIISFMKGGLKEDLYARTKLGLFVGICSMTLFSEILFLQKVLVWIGV